MTTSAPCTRDFTVLDRLIQEALGDLRAARTAVAKREDRANRDLRSRTEEHLNALLDYRSRAVAGRLPRSLTPYPYLEKVP
jgi:hypothetical protein